MNQEPGGGTMTDPIYDAAISAEAVEAACQASWDLSSAAVPWAQASAPRADADGDLIPDPLWAYRARTRAGLEAALAHLRSSQVETATRLGHALGRAEAAEEIAKAIEARSVAWDDPDQVQEDDAAIARAHGKAKA